MKSKKMFNVIELENLKNDVELDFKTALIKYNNYCLIDRQQIQ